jgi:outer membrane protein OmpA-like peptidoglycan-associated protein
MGFEMIGIGIKRGGTRRAAKLVLAGLATLWLAGCSVPDSVNPINWYRDAIGTAADDPPEDTRNTANLDAGNTRDYPNLATVPPPPTHALSTAEREALTQRLVSDRANAKYIDDQLRGGQGVAAPRPAPPVATASATASAAPAASPPAPSNPAAANPPPTGPAPAASPEPAVSPAPVASTPAPTRATAQVARAAPTAAAPPPAAAAPAPAPAPAPSGSSSWVSLTAPPPVAEASPPAAAAAPTPAPAAAPAVAANGQPRESPLTSPAVRSVQEQETPRPAPPPPSLAQGGAANTQIAARTPAAAPPIAPAPAAGTPVAQVTFSDNSARLSPSDRRIVGEVVPLQRQSGAAFRIVGYAAGRGSSASQQLVNFRMALDRANAVASVLAQAGVAPDQILVETAPPTGESGSAANRAEIFLEN